MRIIKVLVTFAALAVNAKKLPERLSKLLCSRSVPNYTKCMSKNIPQLVSILADGVPEIDVPPLNPLKIPEITISSRFGLLGKGNDLFKNVLIEGFNEIKVYSFTTDLNTLSLVLNATIPSLSGTAQYDLDAAIIKRPFLGRAVFNGKFAEIKLITSVSSKLVNREGTEYFELDSFDLKVSTGAVKLEIVTEDPKEQETVNFMVNVLNKDFQTFLNLFSSFLLEKSKLTVRNYANFCASKAPAEEWVPA